MPRSPEESAEVSNEAPAATGSETAAAAPASTTASSGGERPRILLTLDDQAVKDLADERITAGMTMARKDYCLRRWAQGAERGTIAKELTRLQGKPVQYQIVFQAVKDVPQGGKTGAAPSAGGPTAPPPISAPTAPPAVAEAPQGETAPAE